MANSDIGIDLGTASVLVYVKGKGVVLKEPSVVAYDKDTNQIKAIGEEARLMLGRTPGNIMAVRPLRAGVISDYRITEKMLKYFIQKAVGKSFFGRRPRISVCVPSGATEVEKRAVEDATYQAGARDVYVIEEPVAAAIGAGIDISRPCGNMIVDIGGGTTDVAVISLGGLVVSQSVQVGGNKFDEALVEYLRKECSILVGNQTAKNIKKDLATALPLEEDRSILVRGINQLNTSAGTVSFSSAQAYAALQGPCSAVVRAIRWVLERTPPELAADIMRGGIHLTGDAARLFALDRYISENVGIPVLLARDPGDCCILGIGYLTENIQLVTPKNKRQDKPSYK